MANGNNENYDAMQAVFMPIAQGLQDIASRPQKSRQYTNTVQDTTPYALEDMLTARNTIGESTQAVANALAARESPWYATLKALGQIKTTAEPGAWLEAGVQGLSNGATILDDIKAENAQKLYDLKMKDLDERLAYDKEMGSRQTKDEWQTIGYTPWGTGNIQSEVPLTGRPDWDYWIKNWDPDRPTESAYRGQSGIGRYLSNKFVGKHTGSATANAVRQDFDTFTGKNLLKIGRDALKGSGPITDFEDKKYTNWLNEAKDDPVALKDAYVRMVQDVSKKNNWSDMQRRNAYELLGVTSDAADLLPAQIKQDPMRVRNLQPQVKSQPQQMQIGRFSVTVEE